MGCITDDEFEQRLETVFDQPIAVVPAMIPVPETRQEFI